MKHSQAGWISATLFSAMLATPNVHAAWHGIIGAENATTVQPHSLSERNQVETILQGSNLNFADLSIDNLTAAKWDKSGKLMIGRNWTYAYWNDHHGFSADIIKGDFQGVGPRILSAGYAYKDCWEKACIRLNPALATLKIGNQTDSGVQFNLKWDYKFTDRFSAGFHPQYATWKNDENGSTLKYEFNTTFSLGDTGKHKLMFVHERFAVNNRATGMKTRFVGEGDPIAGYVSGTESTIKLRYIYRF
ncbi:hypothetical protein [Vibrio tubiashii]|uniref:hypothetical protein n=1 Tax=Vibrio tubiashii TaxID=29498 RepID=UPI00349EA0CE